MTESFCNARGFQSDLQLTGILPSGDGFAAQIPADR